MQIFLCVFVCEYFWLVFAFKIHHSPSLLVTSLPFKGKQAFAFFVSLGLVCMFVCMYEHANMRAFVFVCAAVTLATFATRNVLPAANLNAPATTGRNFCCFSIAQSTYCLYCCWHFDNISCGLTCPTFCSKHTSICCCCLFTVHCSLFTVPFTIYY